MHLQKATDRYDRGGTIVKRFLAFLTAALLLLGLAACAADGTGNTAQTGGGLTDNPSASAGRPTVEPGDGGTDGDGEAASVFVGTQIVLSDGGITVDGAAISGDGSNAVYAARDVVFYLEGQGFTYGDGDPEDEHSQAEGDAVTVVHIARPGTYVLSGSLSAGQVAVDLGEDAKYDPEAVVTLVLNGVDITCAVAPGIIFYNVYECGSGDGNTAVKDVDTAAAGANIFLGDGTVNTVNGSYVAKIYRSVVLSDDGDEVEESEKLHKYDGAVYSRMSLNVDGNDGVLNINAENEGLDSELHLTVNGGVLNIVSGDDGINANEDDVSVITVNGGEVNVTVTGARDREGDGIDSNGWVVINGGTVRSYACSWSQDSGLDSDRGIYLNGGTVIATGNMLDQIAGGEAAYVLFAFQSRQTGGATYAVADSDGETVLTVETVNDFTYLLVTVPGLAEGTYRLLQDGEVLGIGSSGQKEGFGGPGMGGPEGPAPGGPGGGPGDPGGPAPAAPEPPEGEEPPIDDIGLEPPEVLDPGIGIIDDPIVYPGSTETPGGTDRP